jgi:hypothetical protein
MVLELGEEDEVVLEEVGVGVGVGVDVGIVATFHPTTAIAPTVELVVKVVVAIIHETTSLGSIRQSHSRRDVRQGMEHWSFT